MFTIEALTQAGWIMIPLALCALVGIGAAIHCALLLRRKLVLSPDFLTAAESLVPGCDPEPARTTCTRLGGPFAEILLTVIETRSTGREEAEALIESTGRRATHQLGRGTLALEVVAGVSPLLGLLGTVMGMYRAFEKISEVGIKEAGALSGPISQALVTTIVGLCIAIPAYVAFTWFNRKVEALVLEMERIAVTVQARLRTTETGP